MKIFYTNTSKHAPPNEIFNGDRTPHQEVPARVENIKKALIKNNFEITDLSEADATSNRQLNNIIKKIHNEDYFTFLKTTKSFDKNYLYPSVFNYRKDVNQPGNIVAQRGYFSFDLYTPLNNTTFKSSLDSANLAYQACKHTLKTGETTYALCRPPGHHAEKGKMGGYCYLNNGAVTAQLASQTTNEKVAILDVDFHHGNGAENIFEENHNILTISIHANPSDRFPYFSGEDNTNNKSNANYPLPLGTTDEQYQKVLLKALNKIKEFKAKFLIVSFGADTHESDPIGGFKLTTNYFTQMAKTISNSDLPTVILQEGGYNTSKLGDNVVAFLKEFNRK